LKTPTREEDCSHHQTVNLTLLFGNHCRLGPTPMVRLP